MDYIRSCYKSNMRLYSDRPDVLTPGRWYFSPEGAKVIPFQHKFGSSSWLPNGRDDSVPLGEVGARGAWTNGRCPPQFDGTHFCGQQSAWQNGILYADRPGLPADPFGFPLCCKSASAGGGFLAFNGQVAEPPAVNYFSGAVAYDATWIRPGDQAGLAFDGQYTPPDDYADGKLAFNGIYVRSLQYYKGGLAFNGKWKSGGTVTTTCCASNPTPVELTVIFNSAGCTTIDGRSFDLVYNAITSRWESATFSVGVMTAQVWFRCTGTVWSLNIQELAPALTTLWISGSPTSVSCSPFEVVIDVTGGLDSPCHTIVNTGTVTPT